MNLYIWYNPPFKLGFWLGAALMLFFWLVLVIDLEHRLIMHPVSLFGLGMGFLTGSIRQGWMSTLLGGLAGLGIMLTLYLLGVAFAKIRAKRLGVDDGEEALGFGDVALATVLGLVLGWPLIWFGLLLGILISGAFIILLLIGLFVTGKYKTLAIFVPYGPYLIASATLLIFFPHIMARILP
jgi:leader peptidase (prepilin peptidase)/N-methyltransferase